MHNSRQMGGRTLILGLASLLLAGPALAERTPHDWLSAMGAAVQSTSYEGTVIRIQDGKAEALKVVHTVTDGEVFEKVVTQEGDALEIIRNGSEVHRILPDRRSVVVEKWDDQSTVFSTLPTSDIRFGNEYDVAIDREDRIAGREAVVLAIRPHDHFRYGHRLWLDVETSFPLQTQLVDAGSVIETYSTDQFTWFTHSSAHKGTEVDSLWISDALPAGFKVVSTHEETMPGSTASVIHILFSDGLANVSVFIEEQRADSVPGLASMGSSNSYCVALGDLDITAIGEVPAITVKQIAMSMKRR